MYSVHTIVCIKENIKKGESFCIQMRPFKRKKTERKPFQLLVIIMRMRKGEEVQRGMCVCVRVSWCGEASRGSFHLSVLGRAKNKNSKVI